MAETIVEVIIDPTGEVQTTDVVGHKGAGCKAIAAIFDTGAKTDKSTTKPEYFSGGPNPSSVSVGS